ncbi:MAG: response regulator transcription factor [Lachnospiraceae bacterium]|jgi:DNA-binding response OmpR family regulator|nr:response regulator transcription factor [Lachnospiraceae bacterium]
MNILILEDDSALCRGIALALAADDRQFILCTSLKEAREQLNISIVDGYILDINLPDGSGLNFCAELRAAGYRTPILLLTANDTELDIVAGLQTGADDYVTKPFSLAVLRARVDTMLRRHSQPKMMVDNHGFLFDFEHMYFEKQHHPVELTKTEARLLRLLYVNKGQTMTREQLLAHIWPDGADYVDENALSVSVRRLRAKLETDPSDPQFIKTIHGIGYKWMVGSV